MDFSDNINLKFIEIFDNRLESVDLTMLEQLEFVHLDDNRLTELDLSRNVNLSPIGSGFVGRHNFLKKLTLPNRADLMVDPDVYAEQTPRQVLDGWSGMRTRLLPGPSPVRYPPRARPCMPSGSPTTTPFVMTETAEVVPSLPRLPCGIPR